VKIGRGNPLDILDATFHNGQTLTQIIGPDVSAAEVASISEAVSKSVMQVTSGVSTQMAADIIHDAAVLQCLKGFFRNLLYNLNNRSRIPLPRTKEQTCLSKSLRSWLFTRCTSTPKGLSRRASGKYYLITADGIYFHKETKVGSGLVKVKGIPWLESPEDTSINLNLPKIPGRIIGQALTFFRRIFPTAPQRVLRHSAVLADARCKLWCPEQKVTAGSVS
jgi:hypothetical protein